MTNTRQTPEPISPDIESLLGRERAIEAQPPEVRRRILARARAATVAISQPHRSGIVRFAFAIAAVIVAGTAGSWAAMRVWHRIAPPGIEASPPPALAPVSPPRVIRPAAAVEREVPAAVPAETTLGPRRATPSARGPQARYTRELRLLEPARAGIASGDFAAALSAIAEHGRRFPAGALSEEREALRVRALAGLHRDDDAARAATAFRRRFPSSVLLSHLPNSSP